MLRRLTALAMVAALAVPSAAAFAQDKRFEITPSIGYKFGGSFDILAEEALGEGSFKDGVEYGVSFGYAFNDQFSFEAAWNRQESALEYEGVLSAGQPVQVFDMKIDQWHGNFVWTLDNGGNVKPFFLLGLGATSFSPDADIDGQTKFSWGLGGGIKYFMSDGFGLRLQGRWTPTYMNSSPEYWCYYYCYVIEDAHYASQFDVTGGLILRF